MRCLTVALLFATALAAQRGGGARAGGHMGSRGVPMRGFVGGSHRGPVGRHGWVGRPVYNRPLYQPYGYGIGSYYPFGWTTPAVYAPDPYQYNPAPNVTIIMVPPVTAPAPEPAYSPPVARSAPAEEKPIERPLVTESWAYLIAAKSGTVWLARDYTVANRIVRFTSTAGEQKQLPLAEVDAFTTEQLNRERGVAVRLMR